MNVRGSRMSKMSTHSKTKKSGKKSSEKKKSTEDAGRE